jgi:AGZA family xanthine/uracil permease-like MFS transporter
LIGARQDILRQQIDHYFGISSKGSCFKTEILAGVSTFLALSFIFVVNPAILAQAGVNPSAALFATVVCSAIGTLVIGFWARLPLVVAPGMEMNSYVAFFVVGALGFNWQQALGAVFWSGILFLALTLSGVRERVIAAVPDRMKPALSISVGTFLALVALKTVGVLHYEGVKLHGIGQPFGSQALILYCSLTLIVLLDRFRIRGSVLISIIVASLICRIVGIGSAAAAPISRGALSALGELRLGVIFDHRIWSAVLILFLIDFYGSVAKIIGLTARTTIVKNETVPRMREALLVDSVATTAGATLGTSSLTIYVESAVGIAAGGRTGLTAITCGLLMSACIIAGPLLAYVPLAATTGAIVYVAVKLLPPSRELSNYHAVDLLAAATMQLVVVWTFALDRAMLAGFVIYICDAIRKRERIDLYLVVSTALLAIGVILQLK